MKYGEKIDKLLSLSSQIETAFYQWSANLRTKINEGSYPAQRAIVDAHLIELQNLDNSIKLDSTVKEQFERAFGIDLSSVKVHTGAYAHELTRKRNADAVTIGENIYFANGKYSTDTEEGIRLLAHELQHVIQNQKNQRMAFVEDIAYAEYEADKTESQMEVLRLHNINSPIFEQSENSYTLPQQSSDDSYAALYKSQTESGFTSLEDFSRNNTQEIIEYKTASGEIIEFSQKEYGDFIRDIQEGVEEWIQNEQIVMESHEYEKLLINFCEWANK